MRAATETNVLETEGAISVRRSSIKTSRKSFRMVIDGIYSDKIGSIVQEIAANAFDSSLRAKQSKPFYVHCPTALNPEFFVRDYGTGMTDALMGEVYIVLGESDKDLTDDEVGMWGVGSKSPFAYTDMYHITCYDGVTARHYGYGIANDGIPDLYLMEEQACDEPRGVRVGFAVESADFNAFETAIKKVAIAHKNGFETNLTLPPAGDVLFRGEDWECIKCPDGTRQQTHWFARQGCVLYPIVSPVTAPSDFSRAARVIIDCPIGTVKVTTSREAISYEPEVIEYLDARISETIVGMRDAIWEKVKNAPTVWDFFTQVHLLRFSFVPDNFVHPGTGLSKPNLPAEYPSIFLTVTNASDGRWEFNLPSSIALTAKKDGTAAVPIYVVDDLSPLLDPSRDLTQKPTGHQWLSKSETRRLSRFSRAFMEAKSLAETTFLCNVKLSSELLKSCFPHSTISEITFDDFRKAVPRHGMPTGTQAKPPIKGLAFAKGAGEQKPVFEIAPVDKDAPVAWVSSDQYRRQAASLFKLARRFEVTALYIAAPGVEQVLLDASIPHLRDLISDKLAEENVSFADWFFVKDLLNDYSIKSFIGFLRETAKLNPKAYDKLAAGKGDYSKMAVTVRRLLNVGAIDQITDDDKKAMEALLLNGQGAIEKPEVPSDLLDFSAASKAITANSYNNPTCKFVSGLPTMKNAKVVDRMVRAILAIQTLIPPAESFN